MSTGRRATVTIDTAALAHNLHRVRDFAPGCAVMAVIKADAYGHGIIRAAEALSDADSFAVAMPREGVLLREAGCNKEIVVLHGFNHNDEIGLLFDNRLSPVLHNLQQVEMLQHGPTTGQLDVWIKVESGMHRLGMFPDDAERAWALLGTMDYVRQVHFMSHFANADYPDNILNNNQIGLFSKVISNKRTGDDSKASMANSAAVMRLPDSHFDVVRPGIMLYGSSPFVDQDAGQLALKAAMQFESRVIDIKTVPAGESIGYGSSYTCERDTRIAIIAAGYGDGYPRHAGTGTPVWLNGKQCALLGRVSMDSISVDIGELEVNIGDRAVLWGRELSVDIIAQHSGTIAYELLCHAGACCGRSVI